MRIHKSEQISFKVKYDLVQETQYPQQKYIFQFHWKSRWTKKYKTTTKNRKRSQQICFFNWLVFICPPDIILRIKMPLVIYQRFLLF